MDPELLWHMQELLRRTRWLAGQELQLEQLLLRVESRLSGMEDRLLAIENTLAGLEQQLSELGDKPSTRIDKIEYRFEQLKVDTLAGTLQIGLAHGASGLIEDLQKGSHLYEDVNLASDTRPEPYASIHEAVGDYIQNGMLEDMDAAAWEAGVELPADPALRQSMAEDLRRQIAERSNVYIKELPAKEGPDEAVVRTILDRIREDVRSGLKQYWQNQSKEEPG